MTSKRSGQQSNRSGLWVLLTGCLFILCTGSTAGWGQARTAGEIHPIGPPPTRSVADRDSLERWVGLPVKRIVFEGVDADRLMPLPEHLAQTTETPLTRESLAQSLRQLYATGLYETVEAEGLRQNDGMELVFKGTPRMFIGTVTVDGAKGATVNAQLERASRLTAGTRFSETKLKQAIDLMREALAENGFHQPGITDHLTPHPGQQLVDIEFEVASGPQARVGVVEVTGDPGMSITAFRRFAHLKARERMDHDTVNRALAGVLKHYQKQNRLEAEIKLQSQSYSAKTNKSDLHFTANRGPIVTVRVEGATIEQDDVKRLVPIYEEGSVDEDLLNEGSRRLRDYFQRLGYFDVKVEHKRQSTQPDEVEIVYHVTLGPRRRVERVSVSGNHYFDSATLKDLLSVHAADLTDHHGLYSQALVASDVSALEGVYQNNGFSKVRVTPDVSMVETANPNGQSAKMSKTAGLAVDYHIEEGPQQRVGTVTLEGNDHVQSAQLIPLLNTAPRQLLSQQNLAGDRDALRTNYLNRGFDQARVDVQEEPEKSDPERTNVVFHITEGPQIFVRKVLVTGLRFTRPDTVAKAITLQPGEPLNPAGLLETQRNLYDFALFNEVNTAIENPNGDETHKTVLVQLTEARRWTLTYGLGFEAQTGTPQNNCKGAEANGVICNPNGKTGISPRVLLDLTRNDLFGREQSASIQGTYGLLEQKVDFIYQNPHFHGNRNFGLTFTGGYANSQDVTTYVASKLDAGLRWTENLNSLGLGPSRANQFIYEFDFRRVKVSADSLQVGESEIAELAAAVRVGGPGMTWIRDTRDSALDSHRGTYTSFQEFFSNHGFGSEAQFNRLDMSNSSYYGFDKNRIVLARNSRYAQERAYGPASDELIPLPERIYAGGPTSLRGFSINAAGPRDPYTGFPIGGAGALINSTELRLPPPTLPWIGDSVSFVLFEDMGNVFRNAGDAWASALRVHQPDESTCKTTEDTSKQPYAPSGPTTSIGPQGECSFNYFSHAPGLGLRYHTPVGPIRLDFSYNLNPPYFPIYEDYSQPSALPYIGHAGHFNFFFSLGQTF